MLRFRLERAMRTHSVLLCAAMLSPGVTSALQRSAAAPQTSATQATTTADVASGKSGSSEKRSPRAEITEEELRRRLAGKTWYLRGDWTNDSLEFSMHGIPENHPAVGPWSLCLIRVDKVRLTRKRVELEGARYAVHFLGALPNENSGKSSEEIRITPKKKVVRIEIAREQVVKPKKSSKKDAAKRMNPTMTQSTPPQGGARTNANMDPSNADAPDTVARNETTTESPAVAEKTLDQALDRIFAASVDKSMLASLPEYWRLYFIAQQTGQIFEPDSGTALSARQVDRSARLLKAIDPASNDLAQTNGIAGRSLYRVVVEANGKPGQIAILRPIGFGLDENAVAAIRSASFAPAEKAGHPVTEALDLAVTFRIYSRRTASSSTNADKTPTPSTPVLPGPYSAQRP